MKVLGSRVDALVVAFRVRLDPAFVATLREQQTVANEHGRVAFRWAVNVPDPGTSKARLGPQRARYADDADKMRRVSRLWGELGFSAQRGVWRITNEPFFRIQVKETAEGGGATRVCASCSGAGWSKRVTTSSAHLRYDVVSHDRCGKCSGVGALEDPGWTIEIIWYAQELARIGLAMALQESEAIAAMTGEVLESRLRRIDLCADIEGWEIRREDEERLAKRPRARYSLDFAVPGNDTFERPPSPLRCGPHCKLQEPPPKHPSETCTCGSVNTYGSGGPMARRKITGISVGRGGSLMARIYDKRAELERDEDRRGAEEERWTDAGWDGESSVARVEFQIRGVALAELGLRDPDGCVIPVFQHQAYTDRRGKRRIRAIVLGHRVLTTEEDGREVQATIVHRLEAVWRTCLDWVRLVVPAFSRSGKPLPTSRLKDDPRWELLRSVTFRETRDALPIRRYRPRGAASAAQALGVTLSQAGRVGSLRDELPEEREAYDDDAPTEAKLRERITALKLKEAHFIVDELMLRHGGPAGASRHFAIRHNAARARFMRGVELVFYEPHAAEEEPHAKVA